MNTDIQAKIENAAISTFPRQIASIKGSKEEGFIIGATHILQHPELLREQMEVLLEWFQSTKKERIGFLLENGRPLSFGELFDLHIEYLKNNTSK